MKYQIVITSTLLLAILSTKIIAQENAEHLYTKLCASCHVVAGKPTIAPPIFGVINHVKIAYPTKEEFVERIVKWVENPTTSQALMPGAIKKFGLMPKLAYNSKDVRIIAEYLYDGNIALPNWYIEHYQKEHGHKPQH